MGQKNFGFYFFPFTYYYKEEHIMKAKKTARILYALSAAALCLTCISAPAFAGTYNGGERGIVKLNGWNYDFFTRLDTGLIVGGYVSSCTTDAAIVRSHYNLYGKWRTKNYGYVTAFGGSYLTPEPMYGTSRSRMITCPKGAEQIVEYTRVDTTICMSGDVSVFSEIYRVPN